MTTPETGCNKGARRRGETPDRGYPGSYVFVNSRSKVGLNTTDNRRVPSGSCPRGACRSYVVSGATET